MTCVEAVVAASEYVLRSLYGIASLYLKSLIGRALDLKFCIYNDQCGSSCSGFRVCTKKSVRYCLTVFKIVDRKRVGFEVLHTVKLQVLTCLV